MTLSTRQFLGMFALTLSSSGLVQAQEPAPPVVGISLRPHPPVAIPTDPLPHEGAMIDIPIILEPPDIIIVEVLQTLPGRPITGERLIRPDGKISLGFYGEVHVRGLTLEQAKTKVALHLRQFITDEVLGLVEFMPGAGMLAPNEAEEAVPEPPLRKPHVQPDAPKAHVPIPPDPGPEDRARPRQTGLSQHPHVRPASVQTRLVSPSGPRPVTQDPPGEDDVAAAFQKRPLDPMQPGMIAIGPQDTNRVFVDIVSHNTKVYYVQGDVATPGRLPFTGKETVLDALNFAGGLVTTAEPKDVHLYRPGVGGKPTQDYRIDLQAIWRGDAVANLQVFPNDRLIIGRNPSIKRAIEQDRNNAPIRSMLSAPLGDEPALDPLNSRAEAREPAGIKE